jgi:hypothetical protein
MAHNNVSILVGNDTLWFFRTKGFLFSNKEPRIGTVLNKKNDIIEHMDFTDMHILHYDIHAFDSKSNFKRGTFSSISWTIHASNCRLQILNPHDASSSYQSQYEGMQVIIGVLYAKQYEVSGTTKPLFSKKHKEEFWTKNTNDASENYVLAYFLSDVEHMKSSTLFLALGDLNQISNSSILLVDV